MSQPNPAQTFELAQKISELMDDYFTEHDLTPDEEVLLVVMAARTEAGYRRHILNLEPR